MARLEAARKLKAPRHDPEQRFSCGQCTRCCRNFDVPVTAAEVGALRHPALARLWSAEATLAADGQEPPHDPVATLPGGLFRLRRRGDGSCGFLAEDGACRIHAERGRDRKPLACRLFPFRVHPQDGPLLVTASFSCPSVATNTGAPLASQLGEISALGKDWLRAFPQAPLSLRFTGGRPLSLALAIEMRETLLGLLDRKGDEGRRDLRKNAARMAVLLDDWTRHRVGKLDPDAFAEYVRLTGRFAVASTRPVPEVRTSRVGRLLLRGFLLAVVAGRLQAGAPRRGPRFALRARLLRVTLHLHGLWPATEGLDRRAPRRVRVPLDEPALHGLVHHFLRSTLETLPTGRRSLVDELSWAFATLDAALALGAMAAARRGSDTASSKDLVAGFTEAADLAQAATHGPLGPLLQSLTGGLDALRRFATGHRGLILLLAALLPSCGGSSSSPSAAPVSTPAPASSPAATSLNMTLRAQLNLEALGASAGSGIWGYTGPGGRRLALVGTSVGLSVVDVTNPASAGLTGTITGGSSAWREVRTYREYAYVTTEAQTGLDIVDLRDPDRPLKLRTWSETFQSAHTLWIDDETGLLYANGTQTGMHVLDLTGDPTNPREVGRFTDYYIHDSYRRGDRLYAAAIRNGFLATLDVTQSEAIRELGRFTTGGSFTHNAWPTRDGRYLFTTDERAGSPLEGWDLLANPPARVSSYIAAPGTIPHNVMIDGDRLVVSHYTEGVHMLDVRDPERPRLLGFYDTYPGSSTGFSGAWGAYIFPASNLIVVSDINGGLFVVEYTGS